MNQSIQLTGKAYRLRLITVQDAAFVVQIRNEDPERTRYLHRVSSDVVQQEAWLKDYLTRDNEYYWVIERCSDSTPEGLISIYDFSDDLKSAEWGRWIVKPGSLAGVESAYLMYRIAFEILGLESIYCITIAENHAVLSFHDSCGLRRAEYFTDRFQLGSDYYDGVKHELRKDEWPVLKQKLEPHVQMIATRLER